jgi:hypothetical protein
LTTNTTADVDFAGGTPGNYEFTVIARYNDNGTGTTSARACFTVLGVPTTKRGATSGMDNAAIAIYPNPTDNILYVQAPENSFLMLVDINGKTLTQLTTESVETSIDMSSYAQGVYMLQIQTGEAVKTRRIVRN